mmetsp:Transcript_94223/g.253658  ORF Transcript_94223/g.253658 Transcript_94223/m.253658 type:complete len:212 (+) Transcript_94223:180-815(+)
MVNITPYSDLRVSTQDDLESRQAYLALFGLIFRPKAAMIAPYLLALKQRPASHGGTQTISHQLHSPLSAFLLLCLASCRRAHGCNLHLNYVKNSPLEEHPLDEEQRARADLPGASRSRSGDLCCSFETTPSRCSIETTPSRLHTFSAPPAGAGNTLPPSLSLGSSLTGSGKKTGVALRPKSFSARGLPKSSWEQRVTGIADSLLPPSEPKA